MKLAALQDAIRRAAIGLCRVAAEVASVAVSVVPRRLHVGVESVRGAFRSPSPSGRTASAELVVEACVILDHRVKVLSQEPEMNDRGEETTIATDGFLLRNCFGEK